MSDHDRQEPSDASRPPVGIREEFSVADGPTAEAKISPGLPQTEDKGWVDFRDQCRRQMRRPMEQRIKYGFCRMYKPVLDDAPWRAFDTMAEYRAWCEASLPRYLGFKRPTE